MNKEESELIVRFRESLGVLSEKVVELAKVCTELEAMGVEEIAVSDVKEDSSDYSGEVVAICVGHSRRGDQGAFSVGGVSEWDYNLDVARLLWAELAERGIQAALFDNYGYSSYSEAMKEAGRLCREAGATLALELHFNAADGAAEEEEYLYCSAEGKRLAKCLLKAHAALDRDQKTRGIKDRSTGRGSGFLKATPCPAVICEPFFGDNENDWEQWGSDEGQSRLAAIYANGIEAYLNAKK